MKYIFIVLLFGVCVVVGYVMSLKYAKRKKFFTSLITVADKLCMEINFSRERLRVLFANLDENLKKHLLGVDEQFVRFLDRECELVESEIFKKADCLKADEKEAILMFFKMLGRSDVENQTKEISSYVSRFGEFKKTCDEEHKKYGSLSIKLGFICGLFVAVILF